MDCNVSEQVLRPFSEIRKGHETAYSEIAVLVSYVRTLDSEAGIVTGADGRESTSPRRRAKPEPRAFAGVALAHEACDAYDPDYYETQLIRAVESVLSPVGWERDDIARFVRNKCEAEITHF